MGLLKYVISTIVSIGVIGLAGTSLLGQDLDDVSPGFKVDGFRVAAYKHSISINHELRPTDYYKISPYDEALIYATDTDEQVVEKLTEPGEKIQNLTAQVENELTRRGKFWLSLIEQKPSPVEFVSQGTYVVDYRATKIDADPTVKIEKIVSGLDVPAAGYRHTIGFSPSDLVFDDRGMVYLNQADLRLIEMLGLTPATDQVSNKLEIEASGYIAIFNPHLDQALVIQVQSGQSVAVDRVYRLIEVTEIFDRPTTEVQVTQMVQIVPIGQLLKTETPEISFGTLISSSQ